MDKIELSKHIKQGDTFLYAIYSSKWIRSDIISFQLGQVLVTRISLDRIDCKKIGRKKGLENLYLIIEDLKHNDIAVPQFSKIFKLSEEKQKKYWSIVTRYVERNILLPLTVVITPDINETFYDFFYNFSMSIDDNISELLDIAKETNSFHDELSTDICFIVDWFYVLNDKLHISSEIDILPTALSEYYKHDHKDEVMRAYRPIIRSPFKVCAI